MTEKRINPKRRLFLAVAGAVPALAAAAVAKREELAPAALPEVQPDPASGTGYHETEHIRKYYFTAGYF